jgi:hypothetical protein
VMVVHKEADTDPSAGGADTSLGAAASPCAPSTYADGHLFSSRSPGASARLLPSVPRPLHPPTPGTGATKAGMSPPSRLARTSPTRRRSEDADATPAPTEREQRQVPHRHLSRRKQRPGGKSSGENAAGADRRWRVCARGRGGGGRRAMGVARVRVRVRKSASGHGHGGGGAGGGARALRGAWVGVGEGEGVIIW